MRTLLIGLPLLALAIGLMPAQSQPGRSTSWVNGLDYDGERVTCRLPANEHMWNRGGTDGAGMCVNTSIEMAARWQGLEQFRGYRDWTAEREPGGSYPSKVDRQIKAYCKAKGIPVPPYVQYEGADVNELLEIVDRTGRMACITYGYSPRYRGPIAHMTCCPKFNGKYAVCLDNNPVGIDREHLWEWMSREELVKRVVHPRGVGWVFVWLAPPPPPPVKGSQ